MFGYMWQVISDLLWLLKAKFLLLNKYLAKSELETLFFKTTFIHYFFCFPLNMFGFYS